MRRRAGPAGSWCGRAGCLSSSTAPVAGEAGEDQVHVQAPAPGQVLGQDPAEHQADRAAGADDRAVDAERLAALLRVAERRGQDRQGGGREQRAERALGGACRHQHAEAGGRPADGRRGGEAERAGQERDLAPDQVAQPPAEQQQAAERQRVGGHHPLPVHGGEAQGPLRGRQRDVHDRGVQHDHELGEGDGAQDQPPAGVGGAWRRPLAENVVAMPPMLPAGRPAVVARRKRFSAWSAGMPPGAGIPRGE